MGDEMMYRCRKCGKSFYESEIITNSWREYRGEYFGTPAYETVSEDHCPFCNSIDIQEEEDDE